MLLEQRQFVATVFLASLLILIFVIDWPSNDLLNMGYISGASLRKGDWWRLFAAPLLHLGIGHIIGNLFALFLVGLRIEALIGSIKFIFVFVISASVGALGSAAINPPNVGSVGASGAIQGLFSALYVAGLVRDRRTEEGRRICRDALGLGVLVMTYSSISEFAGSAFGVDLTAHVCGGLAGGLAAIILLVPADASVPGERSNRNYARTWKAGAAAALVGMTILLLAIVVMKPTLPYAVIKLSGTAFLVLIALAVSLYDAISSAAPAAHGPPFSFSRVIHTQGRAILFVLGLTLIWALCMYFR